MKKLITILIPFGWLLLLFLVWNGVITTLLSNGHDIYTHLTYAKQFQQALLEGQFPVRWIDTIWSGHSQPLFNYYQVGFYYLNSLVSLIVPSLIDSFKITVASLWILGSLFMFLWTRKFGDIAAITATLVYAFSPYVLLDLFIRSSFPEFTAITFIIGVFLAIDKLITTQKLVYVLLLAILFGMALISHLPATIIFSPILILYTGLQFWKSRKLLKSLVLLVAGGLLGIGLAAFYLLPAILEKEFIQIDRMYSGIFNFHRHFVDSSNIHSYIWGYWGSWGGEQSLIFQLLAISIWILSFLSVIYLVFKRKHTRVVLLGILTFIYAIFLMHPESEFIWEKISFLQYFQFPWRFFMVIPVALALLVGALVASFSNLRLQTLIFLVVALIMINLSSVFLNYQIPARIKVFDLPYNTWTQNQDAKRDSFIEHAYYPQGVLQQYFSDRGRWSILTGRAEVYSEVIKAHNQQFTVNAEDETTFLIHVHDFPGWIVWVNGKKVNTRTFGDLNYLAIDLPVGISDIRVELIDTDLRKVANTVSVVSFILLLLFSLFILFRSRKHV